VAYFCPGVPPRPGFGSPVQAVRGGWRGQWSGAASLMPPAGHPL